MTYRGPLAVALVVVALVAGAAFVVWPRGASPVTEEDALADFRDQATTAATTAPAAPSQPAPGVYRYASSGHEEVQLGPLPAESRTYPDTMALVVVAEPDASCFTVTLNLLDQHTEDTTYCADGEGRLRIQAHRKHQTIGIMEPTAEMTCAGDVLYVPGQDEQTLRCALALSGGPITVDADLAGTSRARTGEAVEVDGVPVDALYLDVTYEMSGDLDGTWHEQLWFSAEDWTLLRVERAFDLAGLATFTERSQLDLLSLEPSR